jgi:alpha-L-fucosidase
VAKGGNLLFNIAPGPEGTWHDGAYALLEEMGAWMKVNGEAIYETRAVAPYKEKNVCFTSGKGDTYYAIYLPGEAETSLPETIELASLIPRMGSKITLLDGGPEIKWNETEIGWMMTIPALARESFTDRHAWVFKVEKP